LSKYFNVTIVMTIVLNEHLVVQQETIKASEFKAKCLQLMDEVKATRKEIRLILDSRLMLEKEHRRL